MWGIIKKAINSTLGTDRFKPLDILIKDIVNDSDKPLNELLFGDKKIISDDDNIYCLVDSFSVPVNETIKSNKRLFIHARGTVSFKTEAGNLIVYQNGNVCNSISNITVDCHDYFDFEVENITGSDITTIITMQAKAVE